MRRCPPPTAIPLHHGIVRLARVDHHESAEGEFGGHCGLCGELVWTDQGVEIFRSMQPLIPALCCVCTGLSMRVISEAFPGVTWQGFPVPDLAEMGAFN